MRKILHEAEDHFVVDDGAGSFRVPKMALRHSTVEKMRRFARGGKVDEDLDDLNAEANPGPRNVMLPGGGFIPPDGADAANAALLSAPEAVAWRNRPEPEMAEPSPPTLAAQLAAREAAAPPMSVPAQAGDIGGISEESPYNAPGGPGAFAPAPQAPAPTPAAPVAAQAQQPAVAPSGWQGQAALNAAIRQEQQGIGAEAQARAAQSQAVGAVAAQSALDQQAMAEKHAAIMAQEQQRADALFRGVMDAKIDPDKFWEQRGTGQRVTAAIGLILGGIGAGINGGPNPAIGIIDKAIDRDLDAQRLNLGKSQAMLAHQMARIGHLETSHQLAKADLLTIAAARIQAAAAKAGSPLAMAEGQKAAGALAVQATQLRQQGAMGAISLQQAQTQLAVQQQHMQALGQLLKGVSGGGGFDRRILEMPGMESYRERAVDLPDGSVALAGDKQEAQKAIDSMQTVSRLKAKLGRYREVLDTGSPQTLDAAAAQAMHADLLAEMGHLHALNRLTDVDLHLFEKQVPNISDWVSFKPRDRQKLTSLGRSIDDLVWSTNKTLLHRPDSARPK